MDHPERGAGALTPSRVALHENGCISLGDLLSRTGPPHDREQALAAYDAACAIPYEGGCTRARELRAKCTATGQ